MNATAGPTNTELQALLGGQNKIDILTELYYNPTNIGAFRGPEPLFIEARAKGHGDVSREDCKNFLRAQSAYVEYKPRRVNYGRNPIKTYELGTIEIDTAHMDSESVVKHNQGFKYILFAYDELSKHVFAAAMKDKTDRHVIQLLQAIADKYGDIFTVRNVYSDKAKEFQSKALKKYEKSREINHYFTESEVRMQIFPTLFSSFEVLVLVSEEVCQRGEINSDVALRLHPLLRGHQHEGLVQQLPPDICAQLQQSCSLNDKGEASRGSAQRQQSRVPRVPENQTTPQENGREGKKGNYRTKTSGRHSRCCEENPRDTTNRSLRENSTETGHVRQGTEISLLVVWVCRHWYFFS